MPAALALALSACATSTTFVSEPPRLDPPPADLTRPCGDPVRLAEGGLTAGEVAGLWGRDRASLVLCRDRHGALVRYYETRDAALAARGET